MGYFEPEPSFCHGLECPHFTVKKTTKDYELRCYQAYKWMSTNVAGYTYDKAVGMGFMRLFKYIQGANNQSVEIPMTAPVLVQIQPAQGPFQKQLYYQFLCALQNASQSHTSYFQRCFCLK